MANVSVYNMEGKEVGTMELNKSTAVDRRRRSIRTDTERLLHPSQQEGEESCS